MNDKKTPRRQFTKQLALGSLLVPTILYAQNKSGSGAVIVGDGEHTYECLHDWGLDSLPAQHQYGWTSNGVALDSMGQLYVSHHGAPGSIFVFDQAGRFVRELASQHRVKEEAAGHGIDIRTEDDGEFLYLSPDHASMAFTKMTLGGEIVWQKGKSDLEKDSGLKLSRYRPTNSSFRPDGGYYLGDGYGSSYVFEYDKHDSFVRAMGGLGNQDGKFNTPHGQWLDDRDGTPKLVVADRANQRLQWFAMDGTHLKSVGGFVKPADIDVQGDWLIVADIGASVTVLNKDNEIVAKLGHDDEWEKRVMDRKQNLRGKRPEWVAGLFVHPHDACFDRDGNIFVSEYVAGGRVTKLRKV
ncbi:NHL repeat-containing protein [Stieleria varia]|uniref:NHL repeat protein n=1 Tax=Stieleria varia TaxID=2528005 RepID=A0A5C6AZV9_9BACT|nr:peptidase [Stieleria varia]TWU04851.1 NHL repeat protein [Stieleria varia]